MQEEYYKVQGHLSYIVRPCPFEEKEKKITLQTQCELLAYFSSACHFKVTKVEKLQGVCLANHRFFVL